MNIITGIIGVAIAVYVIYAAYYYVMQREFLFPHRNLSDRASLPVPADAIDIRLKTSFGQVEAWHLPPREEGGAPHPLAIVAHGNTETIDDWPDRVAALRAMGIAVLLVEYPGYRRSQGEPSQQTVTETMVAAYDHMVARDDIDKTRILYIGRSMGGGAVLALAQQRKPAGIVLLATYINIAAFAKQRRLPIWLVRDPFDNEAVLKQYPGPVCIVHGKQDTVVPYSHGVHLSQVAKDATLITLEGDHRDGILDWSALWQRLTPFLIKII